MSKKMTPCEKLGYKAGDKFKVVDGTGVHYAVGSFITLIHDDGSSCPRFNGVHAIFESGDSFFPLDFVEKVAKLKPAKQALADAIHQNGGWIEQANYAVQSGGNLRIHFTDDDKKPVRCAGGGWKCQYGFMFLGSTIPLKSKLKNWHQCILSRDEYFTAYPEQLKVEVKNETKHKVEVEMKSESEMTINASDWHKNRELPPVGEICIFSPPPYSEHYFPDFALKAKGKEVLIIAHTRFNRGVGDVAVMKWDFGDYGGVCSANQMCFIPLLTERDKAIDEMMLECQYAGDSVDKCKKFAIALYDAGYRKEVE